MTAFIGIDLGTTFSAIATIDSTGRPVVIHNSDGINITPSCVYESDEGIMVVGDEASKQWAVEPGMAAARFKRDMGTDTQHKIGQNTFSPSELSALVLKKLIQDAESAIGEIGECVVTIPANFSNEAREATMSAAKAAGLNINYIINEPTAAALYYAFKNGDDLHGKYAVYDMGGGTFDVSIIQVSGQDIDVIASNGVSKLGGDDFDNALKTLIFKKYAEQTGENAEEGDFNNNQAEEIKKSLSKRLKVLATVNRKQIKITREEFEEVISTLVTQAEMLCEATIEDAGIAASDIRAVFLAGGSTRIPLVQESVKRTFSKEPESSVNVDEVVALGAALYAAYKGDRSNLTQLQKNSIEKIKVSESANHCFGTLSLSHNTERGQERMQNSILINKGDKIPCSISESFYTTIDGQERVSCQITQSTSAETDPRFVSIIWEGELALPPNRPKEQEIKVTYSYDESQIMHCSFVDVATGRETKREQQLGQNDSAIDSQIDKFMVE